MNLIGDPIGAEEAFEFGLVNRVVPDHELLDTALAWARKLAEQAPLAVEQIKQVCAAGDLDAGIEAEKAGFATAFQIAGRQGRDQRLPGQAQAAQWRRGERASAALAELVRDAPARSSR